MMIVKSSWEYIHPKSLYVAVFFFFSVKSEGRNFDDAYVQKKLTGACYTRFLL